jgi:acyl-homoserine-lactone acylase
MNANDSYWLPNPDQPLTGFPQIIGCEECARSVRTQMVAHYIMDDIENGVKQTPARFAGHEFENRALVAERAKAGGNLDTLCAATGETDACEILKSWDGHYNADAVGPILFQAFIDDAASAGLSLWQNPWSASNPLNTPNTLSTDPATVAILKKAIDDTRSAGLLDATWGTANYRQLADGTHIPVSGGPASAGIANVNTGKPIAHGSSHIQSIAFTANGGVSARTMLTYSQSTDPHSRNYTDQTRLYAKKTWVTFPWTGKQIHHQLVRTIHLKG